MRTALRGPFFTGQGNHLRLLGALRLAQTKPVHAGPVSQSNPVQTMRPFLIPGTVSFAPDTGTPAFDTVGASTVSFPGHTVPEGNETVPLIRNAVLANTWSRAFETVTVQEIETRIV